MNAEHPAMPLQLKIDIRWRLVSDSGCQAAIHELMNTVYRLLVLLFVLLSPSFALAQSQDSGNPHQFGESLVLTVLPIVLIAVVIWLIFVRGIRKVQNSYREDLRQHQQVVEKLLERIAKALERKNGDGA
jgi:hypothetical protein